MNVNVKLSLSDDERRALACYLAGKPVKRLATRADVNRLVTELLSTALRSRPVDTPISDTPVPGNQEEGNQEAGNQVSIPEPQGFCSDDCCKANELLLHRVNVLQHRLDTNK